MARYSLDGAHVESSPGAKVITGLVRTGPTFAHSSFRAAVPTTWKYSEEDVLMLMLASQATGSRNYAAYKVCSPMTAVLPFGIKDCILLLRSPAVAADVELDVPLYWQSVEFPSVKK